MFDTTTPSIKKLAKILKVIIGFCFIILLAYYYIYHSSFYLSSHSYRIISGVNDDETGFYIVKYPTEKRFFYYRSRYKDCDAGGGCEFSFFKSRSVFINNADADSFKVFDKGNYFARDKNNIYFGISTYNRSGTSPYNTTPSVTIIPLNNSNDLVTQLDSLHLTINDDVYFFDKRIEGAKASDFTFLESKSTLYSPNDIQNGFVRSNDRIFKGLQQVKAYGGNEFCGYDRILKEWLLNRDKLCGDDFDCLQKRPKVVSSENNPVKIDVDSFSRIVNEVTDIYDGHVSNKSNYAKDKNHVYY